MNSLEVYFYKEKMACLMCNFQCSYIVAMTAHLVRQPEVFMKKRFSRDEYVAKFGNI